MPSMFSMPKAIFVAVAASLCLPVLAQDRNSAQLPAPIAIEAKWEPSFAEFAEADKKRMPAAGGVVFVGSSSIRLWDNLEQQFDVAPVVIKRGFGGSRLEDCNTYLSRLVTPYKPRLVVMYAGENDLAEGRRPEQVLSSFESFVKGVRAQLPDTRIVYVSIKPSLARETLLTEIRATNGLIKDYVAGLSNAKFIDVFTPMLDSKGTPRTDLFSADKLHMNAAGYAIWQAAIAPSLQ